MQAGATVVQAWLRHLRKRDGCTLRRMVYSSAAAQHALQGLPLLCGNFFCRRSAASRSAFAIAGALTPPLLCAAVQCLYRRFTLRALHLYKMLDNTLLVHEISV